MNVRLGDPHLERNDTVGQEARRIHRLDNRCALDDLDGEQIALRLERTYLGVFFSLLEAEQSPDHAIVELFVADEGDRSENGMRPSLDLESDVRLVRTLCGQAPRAGYVRTGIAAVSEPLDHRVSGRGEIDPIE